MTGPQTGEGARPRQDEGVEGAPNPSVANDGIPAITLARIQAGVMAAVGKGRIGGKDYPNSWVEPGHVVEIDYGAKDCPRCGGDGAIYSQNKPYPDGPCKHCHGTGTVYR